MFGLVSKTVYKSVVKSLQNENQGYLKELVSTRLELHRKEIKNNQLLAFKSHFDSLYGQGLEITNWHMNGNTEPFDNFYDAAMEELNNGPMDN